MPQRAWRAYDVHTFWPVSSQPSSTGVARVDNDARSLPAPGSLNSWHHSSLASRMRGSQRCLLLVGAVREQRRAREVDADAVHRLRGAAAGVLDVVERDLRRASRRGRRTRAASGCRPTDRRPASPATAGPTRARRRWTRRPAVRRWRAAMRGSRRERCPRRREGQVHARGPRTGRGRRASSASCSACSSSAVNGRYASAPRSRTHSASSPHRSRRYFWRTSVRFTILFVPVVGNSSTTRT